MVWQHYLARITYSHPGREGQQRSHIYAAENRLEAVLSAVSLARRTCKTEKTGKILILKIWEYWIWKIKDGISIDDNRQQLFFNYTYDEILNLDICVDVFSRRYFIQRHVLDRMKIDKEFL